MKDKLFDTSALLNLVITNGSKTFKSLVSQNILDLTVYETGNVIWKLAYLQKKITHQHACKLLESFLLLKENMNILNTAGMEEKIKNLSLDTGLTFYDSAYVIAAQKANLVLVTDDASLSQIAKKYLTVIGSNDI
ncbi:MAG: type II toxin-antitoxin system VapC family toxin [Nitrososphaera sp.]|jgi:predicted nucleic acid-binding protein